MNAEQLILKGVKHRQYKGNLVLQLESLKKHFDGLLIHDSDIVVIEEENKEYIKVNDVNFDNAVPKEVIIEEEAPQSTGMTYAEAEELMKLGKLVKLPEWEGFWFRDNVKEEVLVLTKEGEILNTPWDICKESNDWVEAEATPEQLALLESYFDDLKTPKTPIEQIESVVTEETFDQIPELVEAGVQAGEKVLVDAVENVVEDPVADTQPEPVAETPVAEASKKRSTKKTEE